MTRDEFDALPLMLRVSDAMALCDLGRTATYEAIRCGDIPSIKLGRSIRVPKHRLMEMLGLSDNDPEIATASAALSVTDAATSGRPQARVRDLHVEHGS